MRKISFRNIFSSLAWTDVFSKDEPGIARKNMILSAPIQEKTAFRYGRWCNFLYKSNRKLLQNHTLRF